MDYKRLADLLFPSVKYTREQLEEKYPARNLPEGAVVSRMAPSPTGFVHLGNFVQVLISERMTHQSGGTLFLRIEDTDKKRQVAGAADIAYRALCSFNLKPDEGFMGEGVPEKGEYGSYVQSERLEIYHAIAKRMVELGRAFPCF